MTKLETDVTFDGKAISIPKLLGSASKLKKAVDDAIAGKDNDTSVKDLAEDVQKQVKTGSTFKAKLVVRPVFAQRTEVEEFKAYCDDCATRTITDGGAGTPAGGTPGKTNQQIAEDYCAERCRDPWQK